MIYWNNELGLGWEGEGGLIEQYNPAIALDPEFLAFNNDGSELYLNLQDNSALVRISTETATALSIDGYGLKSLTSGAGADIVDDGLCQLVTSDCLYLGRTPDGIATVEYEGTNYVLTADEGSDFDLDDYEEKADSEDIFLADGTFAFANFTFDPTFFVPGDPAAGCAANFNEACESNGLNWCSNFELTIGSSAVDYSDPAAPKMNRIVGFGGRGISLFRVPSAVNEGISLVWDTVSTMLLVCCGKDSEGISHRLLTILSRCFRNPSLNRRLVKSSLGLPTRSLTKISLPFRVLVGFYPTRMIARASMK